jgi:hypothetical protein
MKHFRFIWAFVASIIGTPLVSEAQLQFSFTYSADASDAFNDATDGMARKIALEAAAANFATAFSHTNYNKTIEIEASGYSANNGTLMSAGTYFVGGQPTGFGTAKVTRTKILMGIDLTTGSTTAEGVLNVNFFHSWKLNFNEPPSVSEFDWYGVLYHEFSHLVDLPAGLFPTVQARIRETYSVHHQEAMAIGRPSTSF